METMQFFQSLFFDKEAHSSYNMLYIIPKSVSFKENQLLDKVPTIEEIRQVVFVLDW